jgi:DNA-binding transcriptional MocR family regulator
MFFRVAGQAESVPFDSLAWFVRALGPWQNRPGPLYRRVADAVSEAILSGRLSPGDKLPSHRELAAEFGLSRSTAVRVYDEMRTSGLLESHPRSGNFVSLTDGVASCGSGSWLPSPAGLSNPIDLSKATTRADDAIIDVIRRSADDIPAVLSRDGYDVLGIPELRRAVADSYERRGVPTSVEQILITAGAQQGIDLVTRLLIRANDAVLVESPTYAGLVDRVRHAQAEMISLDVSDQPWDVERFAYNLQRTGARLAFLTPDYHNPTGRLMDDATRRAVAAIAERAGATLVVDETNAELALDDPRPATPPLAAYVPDRMLISIGSLSKCLWAGLRIGWLRSDANTVQALANLKLTSTLANPLLEQLAAVNLLDQRWFGPQMDRRLAVLRTKRALMNTSITRMGLAAEHPRGGLSFWARLPRGSGRSLAQFALSHGLLLLPGSRLSPDGILDGYVRLPFSLPTAELHVACRTLESVWAGFTGRASAQDYFPGPVV